MQMEAVPPPVEEIKPKPGLWGGWPTVGFSAVIFAVFLAVQNLVAVVFMAVLLIQNPSLLSLSSLVDFLTKLQSNGLMLSTAIIASGICGFFFIWLFVKLRQGYSFRDYMEFNTRGWKTWLSLIVVMAGLVVFSSLLDRFHPDTKNLKTMADTYLSSGWTPIFWIATVVFAPVFEESFFRGFLFVGLRNSRVGTFWTVIITAVTFAGLHSLQYDLFSLIAILVLGLTFGVVRLVTNSLWSTIALHAAWNLMSMIGIAMYVKG